MRAHALKVSGSPLSEDQVAQLNRLIPTLSPEQATWLSGYLAGLSAVSPQAAVARPDNAAAEGARRITILYGSETGNAERVAQKAAERAAERGLSARVVDMADYRIKEIKSERLLMVITATHGDGDPPDPATGFYEYLHSRKAPKLEHARFAVLALGDSSYEHFCETGKRFDARLEALGAERLCARVDCDVDFEEDAAQWIESALDASAAHAEPADPARSNVVPLPGAKPAPAVYNRDNPFPAPVLENLVLNGRGSDKEIRHIELLLEGSGIRFAPGDSLAVVAENRPEEVEDLLAALGFSGAEPVSAPSGEMELRHALRRDYEITTLTPRFIERYTERVGVTALAALNRHGDRRSLRAYMHGRFVIDVVREHPPTNLAPSDFLAMLRKLKPREYSIASSYNTNPEEVHLTVAAVRYHSHGRDRHGVASTHLADRVPEGETVPVYVSPNKHFKLPEDASKPIIMVGPGTGVAPFRAFIEEREHRGADGRSWLFFGDRHFRTDFLYQSEWQRYLKEGVLTRMDVAFSRDGPDKVYVQHRMLEHSRELYAWLEDGAHLYVCGDAERMAPDVHAALHRIVENEAGVSTEEAAEYIKRLQGEKRYQRDVY